MATGQTEAYVHDAHVAAIVDRPERDPHVNDFVTKIEECLGGPLNDEMATKIAKVAQENEKTLESAAAHKHQIQDVMAKALASIFSKNELMFVPARRVMEITTQMMKEAKEFCSQSGKGREPSIEAFDHKINHIALCDKKKIEAAKKKHEKRERDAHKHPLHTDLVSPDEVDEHCR